MNTTDGPGDALDRPDVCGLDAWACTDNCQWPDCRIEDTADEATAVTA